MELFFNEDSRLAPDYEYWINQHFWRHTIPYTERLEELRSSRGIKTYNGRAMSELEHTVTKHDEQILFLLMNLDPLKGNHQNLWHEHPLLYSTHATPLDLVQDGLSSGDLKHMKKGDDWLVLPHICIAWAQTQGLRIPEPFLSLLNGASEVMQPGMAKEFKGKKAIIQLFAKEHNISSWSGIQAFLKRNNFTLRHIPRGKKPIPVISEEELDKLNK